MTTKMCGFRQGGRHTKWKWLLQSARWQDCILIGIYNLQDSFHSQGSKAEINLHLVLIRNHQNSRAKLNHDGISIANQTANLSHLQHLLICRAQVDRLIVIVLAQRKVFLAVVEDRRRRLWTRDLPFAFRSTYLRAYPLGFLKFQPSCVVEKMLVLP